MKPLPQAGLAPIILLFAGLPATGQDTLPTPAAIQEQVQRANDYFIANSAAFGANLNNWQRSAYQAGNLRAYQVLGLTNYLQWATAWATLNQWLMGPLSPGSADDYACGQTYIDRLGKRNDRT